MNNLYTKIVLQGVIFIIIIIICYFTIFSPKVKAINELRLELSNIEKILKESQKSILLKKQLEKEYNILNDKMKTLSNHYFIENEQNSIIMMIKDLIYKTNLNMQLIDFDEPEIIIVDSNKYKESDQIKDDKVSFKYINFKLNAIGNIESFILFIKLVQEIDKNIQITNIQFNKFDTMLLGDITLKMIVLPNIKK